MWVAQQTNMVLTTAIEWNGISRPFQNTGRCAGICNESHYLLQFQFDCTLSVVTNLAEKIRTCCCDIHFYFGVVECSLAVSILFSPSGFTLGPTCTIFRFPDPVCPRFGPRSQTRFCSTLHTYFSTD